MRPLLFVITASLFICCSQVAYAQEVRTLQIPKLKGKPLIDGRLGDEFWKDAAVADSFLQFSPYSNVAPRFQSRVYIAYSDNAIYVGARLFDEAPDSILTEIGKRDYIHDSNAELFGVLLNPFDDDINMVEFMVSSAGAQTDMKHTGGSSDINWNAVWHSAVSIDAKGWVAEMEIPYSALRFPNKLGKPWGVHFFRRNRRYREWSSWVSIDNSINEFVSQSGKLIGIKDIDPPFRLSFTPYLSGYMEETEGHWNSDVRGGMDLKYGINQSFTLDMTLIPDFGQVKSDDKILNLSPFEVRYAEKRPFFTEGTELFSKGGIFYSRRIGSEPEFKNEAEQQLEAHEVITRHPANTQMINATKVSGRTSNGLGIGFFNAMTSAAYTTIRDTLTNKEENFISQGFTNYNMVVLDQNLPNNSHVSLANTSVIYGHRNELANVSAMDVGLSNKRNSYRLETQAALSHQSYSDNQPGYKVELQLKKTKGLFKWEYAHNIESHTYNHNDMGYLQMNNESTHEIELRLDKNEPFGKFLEWTSELEVRYSSLYKPRKFNEFAIGLQNRTTLKKNYLYLNLSSTIKPVETHDYYEARVAGQVFKRPAIGAIDAMISTDYRRTFAFDWRMGYKKSQDFSHAGYWYMLSPRWRAGDQFNMVLRYNYEKEKNDVGYVKKERINNQQTIYFGKRNIDTYNTIIEANLLINEKLSVSLRNRYYWRTVEYSQFYTLEASGYLGKKQPYGDFGIAENINYNAFTLDAQLLWHFAPGSELSLVWKNQIYTSDQKINQDYFNNLNYALEQDQINSISIKFLYYLDYLYLKRLFVSE